MVDKFDGDLDLAIEILDVFLADTRERLTSLKHAIEGYDFDTAQQNAYNITSSAENVNATNIAVLGGELMQAAKDKQQEFAASLVEDIAEELVQMEAIVGS